MSQEKVCVQAPATPRFTIALRCGVFLRLCTRCSARSPDQRRFDREKFAQSQLGIATEFCGHGGGPREPRSAARPSHCRKPPPGNMGSCSVPRTACCRAQLASLKSGPALPFRAGSGPRPDSDSGREGAVVEDNTGRHARIRRSGASKLVLASVGGGWEDTFSRRRAKKEILGEYAFDVHSLRACSGRHLRGRLRARLD